MINITFRINYHTVWGQNLYICGSSTELGSWDEDKALRMTYLDNGNWSIEVKLKALPDKPIRYKYFLEDQQRNEITWEWGKATLPADRWF